jgi:hypothetical protein
MNGTGGGKSGSAFGEQEPWVLPSGMTSACTRWPVVWQLRTAIIHVYLAP